MSVQAEPSSARAGSSGPRASRSSIRARCPQGFRAAGVACGIKPSGRPDVGLLACDGPEADVRRAVHPQRRRERGGEGLAARRSSGACAPWS